MANSGWRVAGPGLVAVVVGGIALALGCRKVPDDLRFLESIHKVKAGDDDRIDARSFRRITSKELQELRGVPDLKHLLLDGIPVTDADLAHASCLLRLETLSLSNTAVTDAGLDSLRFLRDLQLLRLDRVSITDAGLGEIQDLTNLRELSLWKTAITDTGLAYLKGMSSLEKLSLDETAVSDEGLQHLKDLPHLKRLSVWRTRVTEAGVRNLKTNLPDLEVNR